MSVRTQCQSPGCKDGNGPVCYNEQDYQIYICKDTGVTTLKDCNGVLKTSSGGEVKPEMINGTLSPICIECYSKSLGFRNLAGICSKCFKYTAKDFFVWKNGFLKKFKNKNDRYNPQVEYYKPLYNTKPKFILCKGCLVQGINNNNYEVFKYKCNMCDCYINKERFIMSGEGIIVCKRRIKDSLVNLCLNKINEKNFDISKLPNELIDKVKKGPSLKVYKIPDEIWYNKIKPLMKLRNTQGINFKITFNSNPHGYKFGSHCKNCFLKLLKEKKIEKCYGVTCAICKIVYPFEDVSEISFRDTTCVYSVDKKIINAIASTIYGKKIYCGYYSRYDDNIYQFVKSYLDHPTFGNVCDNCIKKLWEDKLIKITTGKM